MAAQQPSLSVIARAPFELYFEGPAKAVSGSNKVGPFDILPGHADFFSMLLPGDIIVEPLEGEPVTFSISNGIITVRDDEALLFVNM
jgi:F0F1-type ATP synthase epsilon subunit